MGRWEAWSVVVFRSWPRHGTINVGNNKIVVGRMGNISFTAADAVFFYVVDVVVAAACVCAAVDFATFDDIVADVVGYDVLMLL